jgi:hypothetical protein
MTVGRLSPPAPTDPLADVANGWPAREAPGRRELLGRLDDEVGWADAAATLLARFGFLAVQPPHSGDAGHLLVALRDRPTLRHFDPELVSYYAPSESRAALRTIDRHALAVEGARLERRVLWGHVHVVDRVPVENRFLTFGGDLRIAEVDPTLTVVDLCSPGPIVRWGGSSQGSDPLAGAIGAFFGRLMVPVDFQAGMEARLDATPANVLYGAFLLDYSARKDQAARRGIEPTSLDLWVDAAAARARSDAAVSAAAEQLLRDLHLP